MKDTTFTKPSGNLLQNKDGQFTFVPDELPPSINYDEDLTTLISEASLQLGNLSGIGKLLPNPNLLIGPYLRVEAVLSSKIEGTQASILDVFQYEAGGVKGEEEIESKSRVLEVVNYVAALNVCLHEVRNGRQIDIDMIKTAHSILMDQVRGQELHPGEFRTVQNWIGLTRKIEDATYVPAAAEYVKPMMEDLVKFIQNPPRQIPVLIQCAMVHYQFEAIHPFADGNGRIGRLLMSVLLSQRNVLDQPLLYLSAYIEKHKEEYYSLLLEVSRKSDWDTWIRFFLVAVITQTKAAATNIQQLLALKSAYEQKLNSKKVSHSIARITDYLFSNPIVTVPGVSKYLGITYRPTKNAILALKDMGILKEHGIGQKGRMYIAHEILSILR